MLRSMMLCMAALMLHACCATPDNKPVAAAEQPVVRHVSMQEFQAAHVKPQAVSYHKEQAGITQPDCAAHFNHELAAAQTILQNHRRM